MADEPRTEVDDNTLARILRCDPVAVRRYVRLGIIQREASKKFALFQSIGNVVEHLRNSASRLGTGDAMKAGAALKNTQRQLAEVKLQKLNGALISMPELEALWGDLAAASKWLYLSLPGEVAAALKLSSEAEKVIGNMCAAKLREVAFSNQLQLPGETPSDDDDSDEDIPDEPAIRESLDGHDDADDRPTAAK